MSSKETPSSYFVNRTNPEIFTAVPRPGGVLKIDFPPKRNKVRDNALKAYKEISISSSKTGRSGAKSAKTADSKPSDKEEHQLSTIATKGKEPLGWDEGALPRDYKVKQSIATTPWSVEFNQLSEAGEQLNLSDLFQDSVEILAMSISIIMLLSRDYAITDTQYKWLISYLDCIRDEFGRTPPNVQGVLNHISEVTGGNIKSFFDEEEGLELAE